MNDSSNTAPSNTVRDALKRVIAGQDLSRTEMGEALGAIMDGQATDAQVAGLLVALRMKGETVGEIAGAVEAMRRRVSRVSLTDGSHSGPLLDTCGTGGDGAGTFNISTAVSFVCAAAGCVVAKHGNRAISSSVGSADVLEALGVRIDLPAEAVATCIAEVGIGFMFAPMHHAALRHAMPARRQLGVRTMLNLLGPLTNPAGATHQLIGLFAKERLEAVATVLGQLGSHRALVVHGEDGLDELTLSGRTFAAFLSDGEVSMRTIVPEDVGIARATNDSLAGGDAAFNAALITEILSGRQSGPCADIVRLNAGAALWVAEVAPSLADGVSLATELLASGAAATKLTALVAVSQRVAPQ